MRFLHKCSPSPVTRESWAQSQACHSPGVAVPARSCPVLQQPPALTPHQPSSPSSSCSDHEGRMEDIAKFSLAGLRFLFLSSTACKKAFKRWDMSLCFPRGLRLFMAFFPLSPKGLKVTGLF